MTSSFWILKMIYTIPPQRYIQYLVLMEFSLLHNVFATLHQIFGLSSKKNVRQIDDA